MRRQAASLVTGERTEVRDWKSNRYMLAVMVSQLVGATEKIRVHFQISVTIIILNGSAVPELRSPAECAVGRAHEKNTLPQMWRDDADPTRGRAPFARARAWRGEAPGSAPADFRTNSTTRRLCGWDLANLDAVFLALVTLGHGNRPAAANLHCRHSAIRDCHHQ